MSAHFERVAVLGLGLLGGSVALAARRRGVAATLVGAARRPDAARAALAAGLVDEAGTDPAAAARGADLLVIATPLGESARALGAAAPALASGALVTDVGSVKAPLTETLPGLLPPGVVFVGAHPMAGSHRRGPDHARDDLFEGAACVLTPTSATPAAAVAQVRGFWEALGARVLLRDPLRHDEEVGWVSHVPHALAYAFARALEGAPGDVGAVAGAGFRDFTRIAHSDPELWAEILVANRKAVAGPLRAAAAEAERLARLVEAAEAEPVESYLAAARDALAKRTPPHETSGTPERNPSEGSDESDS